MTRRIILIAAFFSTLQYSFAQTGSDKNVLSLSIGPSFPVGNFSSVSPSNQFAGYAKVGETANISFVHKLNKNTGLMAMLYGQRNGLNTKELEQQLSGAEIFPYNGSGFNHYPNWEIDKKSWYLESLLVGITEEFFLKRDSKFSITARALAGVAYLQMPKLNGSSKTDTSYAIITQNSAAAFGFSYLAGAGVKYTLNKRLYLLFGADYFGTATINFKNITEKIAGTSGGLIIPNYYSLSNSSNVSFGSSGTGNNKQPVGTINVNFGIGVRM